MALFSCTKGGILIELQSNIIYNFEDLKALLSDKTKEESYYLILDDMYFEKIDENMTINREVFTISRRIVKPFNIVKFITFKTEDKYSTKEVYDLLQILRKYATILVTLFNPTQNECTLIFISNRDDSKLEHHIKTFLEVM